MKVSEVIRAGGHGNPDDAMLVPENYTAKMSKARVWGDILSLWGACHTFGVAISLLSSTQVEAGKVLVINPRGVGAHRTLQIGHRLEKHYYSLVDI